MSDEPGFDEIALEGVPESLRDETARAALHFATGLFRVDHGQGEGELRFVGSGTFVTVDAEHYVLTAGHVWRELQGGVYIGLGLTEDRHRFVLPPMTIEATVIYAPTEPEWGPDLAFLRLPDAKLGDIKARKTFYNLSKRRDAMLASPPDPDLGLWVVLGAPAETSALREREAAILMTAHFSGVDHLRSRKQHDYCDVGVGYITGSSLPVSFGGVSGGGLWQFTIGRADGLLLQWDGRLNFEGVAFYESPIRRGRRFIRCHGRRSVYGVGIDRVRGA